jgi:hypothetical protein
MIELVCRESDRAYQALCDPGSCSCIRIEALLQRPVAQEAEDPATLHAVLFRAVALTSIITVEDYGGGDPAGGVGLRVEEGFAVADIHGGATSEVRHGEVVEVVAGDEDLAAGEVGFEESWAAIVAVEFAPVVVCYFVWRVWW